MVTIFPLGTTVLEEDVVDGNVTCSVDDGNDLDWTDMVCESTSPENIETGLWNRNVTFDPVLVKPLRMLTVKICTTT